MYITFSLSLLTFAFSSGGGAIAIGRPFVQVGETAVMWRVAYFGGENKFRGFQNSPVISVIHDFDILALRRYILISY